MIGTSTGIAETMSHGPTDVVQKHRHQTPSDVAVTATIITTTAIMNTLVVGTNATTNVALVLGPLTNETMKSGSSSKNSRKYVWLSETTL